jgi:hypothetical protein
MDRILVVAYRPHRGKRDELLGLLAEQHARARERDILGTALPMLCEGVHGEIIYIVTLRSGAKVDTMWEDESYQDIDARIALVARLVPIGTLDEAHASYMDLGSLPLRAT